MIKRLALIGTGLIGGSLALALKSANYAEHIVGYNLDLAVSEQAKSRGIIDSIAETIPEAIQSANVIVLAVPMGAMATVMTALAPHLTNDMVLTDVGSVKTCVAQVAEQVLQAKHVRFIPGHPIAGTEQSGPAAALATLYQQQRVVLTPGEDADQQAVTIIEAMWQAAGAEVVRLSVAQHDAMLAATSHLPHILAFNLVSLLAQGPDADDVLNYAAGGFRDFSRIASSHPAMWRDICLTNREAILPILADYQQQLTHIKTAIEQQQGEALLTLFEQAKQMRDARFLAEK